MVRPDCASTLPWINNNSAKTKKRISEVQFTFSQISRSSYRNPALIFIVDRAIKMIYYPVMFNHKRFVCKTLIKRFRRSDQVRPCPVDPVYQVVGTGKAVKRIFPAFPECAEIKHYPYIAHLLN